MRQTKILILVLAVLALIMMPLAVQARTIGTWTPIYEGIDYATGSDTVPQLMVAYALKIDLQNPYVAFYATPKTAPDPYDTYKQTTLAFLQQYELQVAINTVYFNPSMNPTELYGAEVSNGVLVNGGSSGCSAQLRITQDNIASIVYTAENPVGFWTVAGGYQPLIIDGVKTTDTSSTAPRTAAGISQDGRYVIMVVVDGRQSGYSVGATLHDMADWMADFGAYNAMNCDGGGSSTMVREDIGVVNSPSDGSLRLVGANLGVSTLPLQEIIVDNPAGSWSSNWYLGSSATGKYGADYRYRSTAAVSDRFTWTPEILTEGNYEVYAWWSQGTNRSASAPYMITYDGGSATVNVNQQANGGKWNSLGTYHFAEGTSGNVKLSCWTTTGYVVIADAVKFVRRP